MLLRVFSHTVYTWSFLLKPQAITKLDGVCMYSQGLKLATAFKEKRNITWYFLFGPKLSRIQFGKKNLSEKGTQTI